MYLTLELIFVKIIIIVINEYVLNSQMIYSQFLNENNFILKHKNEV